MTNLPTRMRDAGRSWTEIADTTGLSVRQAKVLVEVERSRRRRDLATSHTNEEQRGLLEMCDCGHQRKFHELFEGECDACGPVRETYVRRVYSEDGLTSSDQIFDERPDDWRPKHYADQVREIGCSEFYLAKRGSPRWMFDAAAFPNLRHGHQHWRRDSDTATSKPTDEQGRIKAKFRPFNQSWFTRWGTRADMPQPSARTQARRERRKRKTSE